MIRSYSIVRTLIPQLQRNRIEGNMVKQCFIVSKDSLHSPILLADGAPFFLGRTHLTKIKNQKCSRKQLLLTPNYNQNKVLLIQTGANPSRANGKTLSYHDEVTLEHGSTFEALVGQYIYEIQFVPNPYANKRKMENEENQNVKIPKLTLENTWESVADEELLVFNRTGMAANSKIAAYDMDGTLITTQSGRVFPKDRNDWKILYSEVPGKLKKLVVEGYKIVLFTNQAGINTGKQTVEAIEEKIEKVLTKLGIEAQAFVSTKNGKYRKPIPGMWNYFVEHCNNGLPVDMEKSFYVGDAAGRTALSKEKKKDHSNADRLFALNIGIPFFTPEEHFLGSAPRQFLMPEFNPQNIPKGPLLDPEDTKLPKHEQEAILLIGYPGCGKSTFFSTHLEKLGYKHISRDVLGTWQKCVYKMEDLLKAGKNVVIDNTNPDVDSRKRYVDVASKLKIPIRCFVFNSSIEQAKHNNKFRELSGSVHQKVSDMVFNSYRSKYEDPTLSEGFDDIIKINFVPSFRSHELESLYRLYLLS